MCLSHNNITIGTRKKQADWYQSACQFISSLFLKLVTLHGSCVRQLPDYQVKIGLTNRASLQYEVLQTLIFNTLLAQFPK